MRTVIVGVGKIGSTLLEKLVKEGHDVSIIDKNQEKVEYLTEKYDIKGVVGTGAERDVMLAVEANLADFVISCTPHDDFNILVCVLAKKIGTKKTIAMVSDPRYFRELENIKNDLNIDKIFNPEYRTALEIAKILRFPSALSIESFAHGNASMVEFQVDEDDPIIGKSVIDIVHEFDVKILFGAVVRGDKCFIPDGKFIINSGDYIHIIGTDQNLTDFSKKLRIYKPRAKSVFIIGGGKVSYYLANALTANGIDVKIIENDKTRCEELSSQIPNVTILYGDGTNAEVLDEEKIQNADACVLLLNSEEENVIVSLYAQSKNVKKVITQVDSPSLANMIEKIGIDTLVSPRSVIANHVVRFVRAHREEKSTGMKRLYMIEEGCYAMEFVVKESFAKTGIPIRDLRLHKNIVIGGIIRDGKYILPNGDADIEIGDRVVIVTTQDSVNELNDVIG